MKREMTAILLMLVIAGCQAKVEERKNVCISNSCFSAEIADRADERSEGLMFRQSLGEEEGMLFIFESEGVYPFWMKNTLIPLDIIWIGNDKKIIFISKNSQPCSESVCNPINPGKNALYVLEINAGLTDKKGIKEGDSVSFK